MILLVIQVFCLAKQVLTHIKVLIDLSSPSPEIVLLNPWEDPKIPFVKT